MWPRLKNSPHTYAHEGLESIFLLEFIELQWVQTDFLRLSDNNNTLPNLMMMLFSVTTGVDVVVVIMLMTVGFSEGIGDCQT